MKILNFFNLSNLIFNNNIVNKRSILNASILSYINLFLSSVFALIVLPLIVNALGSNHYGIYVLLISTIGYFSLFNLGFTDSIIKYVSEYHALDKTQSIKKITATSTYFFLILSLIIFSFSILFVNYLPFYFDINGKDINLFRTSFLLLSFNFVISLQGGLLASVISGYQSNQIVKLFNLIQIVLYNTSIFYFISSGHGLLGIIYPAIISSIFFYISCLFYIFYKKINYTFNFLYFDKSILFSIFPYSGKIFVMTLTSQILYRSDALVIGFFLGTVSLTNFDIMYKISFMVATFGMAISDVLFPTFARLNGFNDKFQINKLLKINLYVSFSLVSFLLVFLFVWGESIFLIWFGKDINISMYVFMLMLSLNFFHALGPCFVALKAVGKINLIMYSSILNALFNLGLSIYLVKIMGIPGVLLGTLISHLVTDTLFSFYSLKKHLKISIFSLVKGSIFFPVLISILFYPIVLLLFLFFKSFEITLITITISFLLTFFLYCFLNYFLIKEYIKK